MVAEEGGGRVVLFKSLEGVEQEFIWIALCQGP